MNKKCQFKSGFVAITGAPNAGKSTLLNQILGEKVAIATPKPQTTRHSIKGILTGPDYQVVFIDTPGIHVSKRLLNKVIVKSAMDAMKDADLVLALVDASDWRKGGAFLNDILTKTSAPFILALNKIDMIARASLLPMIDLFRNTYPFKAIVPISARYNDGIRALIGEITALLPEGPRYYEGSYLTDQNMDELASEIVREKIFLAMREEVPYSVAVESEVLKDEKTTGLIEIRTIIYVEKPSQKGMIIGKDGNNLKKIGTLARIELEKRWNAKIYLDLWVKVLKDWTKDERSLKRLGLGI